MSNCKVKCSVLLDNHEYILTRNDYIICQKKGNNDCCFEIQNTSVDVKHALLSNTNTGVTLVDLSSTTGTYVNGVKLAPNVKHKISSLLTFVKFGDVNLIILLRREINIGDIFRENITPVQVKSYLTTRNLLRIPSQLKIADVIVDPRENVDANTIPSILLSKDNVNDFTSCMMLNSESYNLKCNIKSSHCLTDAGNIIAFGRNSKNDTPVHLTTAEKSARNKRCSSRSSTTGADNMLFAKNLLDSVQNLGDNTFIEINIYDIQHPSNFTPNLDESLNSSLNNKKTQQSSIKNNSTIEIEKFRTLNNVFLNYTSNKSGTQSMTSPSDYSQILETQYNHGSGICNDNRGLQTLSMPSSEECFIPETQDMQEVYGWDSTKSQEREFNLKTPSMETLPQCFIPETQDLQEVYGRYSTECEQVKTNLRTISKEVGNGKSSVEHELMHIDDKPTITSTPARTYYNERTEVYPNKNISQLLEEFKNDQLRSVLKTLEEKFSNCTDGSIIEEVNDFKSKLMLDYNTKNGIATLLTKAKENMIPKFKSTVEDHNGELNYSNLPIIDLKNSMAIRKNMKSLSLKRKKKQPKMENNGLPDLLVEHKGALEHKSSKGLLDSTSPLSAEKRKNEESTEPDRKVVVEGDNKQSAPIPMKRVSVRIKRF